jgi:hypothetical protein
MIRNSNDVLTWASTLSAVNISTTYTANTTTAGTTTLTVNSTGIQNFTGSTTQTVLLPVTSTLIAGWRFKILNNSTGSITIQSSGGNAIATLTNLQGINVFCILTSGTTAASWNWNTFLLNT